jgi:hypothetical protein
MGGPLHFPTVTRVQFFPRRQGDTNRRVQPPAAEADVCAPAEPVAEASG